MKKNRSSKTKRRVSIDFKSTLNSFIRTDSAEELNIKNAFEKFDEDFYAVNSNKLRKAQSVYRNKEFKNYELVVSGTNINDDSEKSKFKITTQPIMKRQSTIEESMLTKTNAPKFLQRFFPSNDYLKIPFERTPINSLPYQLHVEFEQKGKCLKFQVTQFHTIDRIKEKISSKEKINTDRQALYFEGKQLEGSKMLYIYGIQSSSKLYLKLLDKITIYVKFDTSKIDISTYTSVTVQKIRNTVSTEMKMKRYNFELRYKNERLEDNKELFTYSIENGSEIEASLSQENTGSNNRGFQTVQNFITMTDNLKKCKCQENRCQTIAFLFRSLNEVSISAFDIDKSRQYLNKFDTSRGYHHVDCFMIAPSPSSTGNSVSEYNSTEFSGSTNSLKSAIWAQTDREGQPEVDTYDEQYLKLIAQCQDFKEFKHLLQSHVGTKCNLRSVSLLYKYTRCIVRYIGLDERGNSPEVEKFLDFAKLYFEKYFKKDIIEKGGMDALVLSVSDVD